MAFLLSNQGEKTSPLVKLTRQYGYLLPYPLALLGLLWILALPLQSLELFWHRTYFSENSMLSGQVTTQFGRPQHLSIMQQTETTHIQQIFEALGLDTEQQQFQYQLVPGVDALNGTNVHGIVRAGRSDSVESIVIASDHHKDSVRMLAGLAKLATEQQVWAKDLIFLVTDSGERGIDAWLRAYNGEPNGLYVRSGAIQAALCLELSPKNDKMEVRFEGRGGQLPNLDYVNMVRHISRLERIPFRIYGQMDPNPRQTGWWTKYRQASRLLLRQVLGQAMGEPQGGGLHMAFLRYRIDAVGLKGNLKHQFATRALGRTMEGVLRSLNNLLERFHQSFFFYLLPANSHYISIGDYIPAAILMVASLIVHAIDLWWRQGPQELREDDPRTRIQRINQWHQYMIDTFPVSIAIFWRMVGLGAVLLGAPLACSYIVIADSTVTAYLFTISVGSVTMLLHTVDMSWKTRKGEWRQLKALVCLLVAVVTACLSVINFGLAVVSFLLMGLPLLLVRTIPRGWKGRVMEMVMLMGVSPPMCLWLMGIGLFRGWIGSGLQYPLVCMVYWPVSLLSMVVSLMP